MKPAALTIHMYNVGFGDCFLLEFDYDDKPRFVLIDFGSAKVPATGSATMGLIARDIKKRCDGRRLAVVATHRHRDHISGFAGASGRTIASLEPELVLQPWTEVPDAPEDAGEASRRHAGNQMFIRGLNAAVDAQEWLGGRLQALRNTDTAVAARMASDGGDIAFVGELNAKNMPAIRALAEMGAGNKSRYLRAGDDTGLADLLPGVEVQVLGPPDLTQDEGIAKQAQEHAEFWLRTKALADGDSAGSTGKPLFPDAPRVNPAKAAWRQWTIRRMREIDFLTARALVTSLDRALNNTSLVLLFTVGDKSFLFSGDAQIESWNYIRRTYMQDMHSMTARRICDCVVYKVGHHGSRNATPKFLWDAFTRKKGSNGSAEPIVALMSTLAGLHGSEDGAVPAPKLVEALSEGGQLISTNSLGDENGGLSRSVTFPLLGS